MVSLPHWTASVPLSSRSTGNAPPNTDSVNLWEWVVDISVHPGWKKASTV